MVLHKREKIHVKNKNKFKKVTENVEESEVGRMELER